MERDTFVVKVPERLKVEAVYAERERESYALGEEKSQQSMDDILSKGGGWM